MSTAAEVIAAALAEHPAPTDCLEAGHFPIDAPRFPTYCSHLADVLAEAGMGVVAEAQARVLRETADAWTQGEWSEVMLPHPSPPAVPVIAYSNRMGDWLRLRAARVNTRAVS